jgi:transcriptional regulator GlxA family with amidase domain
MKRRDLLTIAAAALTASVLPSPGGAATPIQRLTPPKGLVKVAFVVGPDSVVIDFAGPWEAFSDVMLPSSTADMKLGFEPVMVSDHTKPLDAGGMIITPRYSYADIPFQPNVIVMGAQGEHSPAKIAWIKKAARDADVVMSVCTGAYLLAKTGLLDGLDATTHHEFYGDFEKQFPKVHLLRGRRYVDNGKIATSGGESSGIDLAFHIVRRYYGDALTAQAADAMEYTLASRG